MSTRLPANLKECWNPLVKMRPFRNTDHGPMGWTGLLLAAALWAARHGGQQATVQHLLQHGANLNRVAPWDGLTPLDAARRHHFDDLVAWLTSQGALPATEQTT